MGNAVAAPLFSAAKDGDVDQIERILFLPGTDVNAHDSKENSFYSALHYAAVKSCLLFRTSTNLYPHVSFMVTKKLYEPS